MITNKPVRTLDEIRELVFHPERYKPDTKSRMNQVPVSSYSLEEQRAKRRRLGNTGDRVRPSAPASQEPVVQPVVTVGEDRNSNRSKYLMVWRRSYPGMKHGRFSCDGTLKISHGCATLLDEHGKVLGEAQDFKLEEFLDGSIVLGGTYECMYSE